MRSQKRSPRGEKSAPQKKKTRYEPPRLTRYGNMKELTQGNVGMVSDGGLYQS